MTYVSICKKANYINKIRDNFFSVNHEKMNHSYDLLKKANCIIICGSGRSLSAAQIGISQLGREKIILGPDNVGFPGIDRVEELYGDTVILFASGSGTSKDPLNIAEETADYIEKKRTDKVKMVAITSNINSPIGKIADEHGCVIEMKGRTKEANQMEDTRGFLGEGIMGDQFELGVLSLCQRIRECIAHNESSEKIFEYAEQQFPIIGRTVDEITCSNDYEKIIDRMIEPHSITLGGVSNADRVASMTATRLMHVKRVLGDEVFVCRREIDPKPRPKSIVILISYSGETKTVLSWFEGFRKINANIIAVSGFKDSTISREANHRLIFGSGGKVSPGSGIRWTKGVNQFYEQAAYVLSPMPIDLCNKLNEMGYEIPERWLKLQHSAVS